MPIHSLLFTLPLEQDPGPAVESIKEIFKKELPSLDQSQKIVTGSTDFIMVLSSSLDSCYVTLRYYHLQRILSIHCEIDTELSEYAAANMSERLKDKLKTITSPNCRVEAIPPIKRNNDVPIFFVTSDGRTLEYDFEKVLVDENSEYQNIKILQSPTLRNCLILNDMQNLGETDLAYTHGLMNHPRNNYKDKEILILGGGDGALLYELLKESPKFVTMVEIDEKVMRYCQQFLRGACGDALDKFKGDKHEIICGDGLAYLAKFKEEGRNFDVIFNDLTDIPISTRENWTDIVEGDERLWQMVKNFLHQSIQVLRPGGLYLNHAIGINCKRSLQEYEKLLHELPVEFSSHTAYVPSFMEDWVFYELRKKL